MRARHGDRWWVSHGLPGRDGNERVICSGLVGARLQPIVASDLPHRGQHVPLGEVASSVSAVLSCTYPLGQHSDPALSTGLSTGLSTVYLGTCPICPNGLATAASASRSRLP